MNLAANVNRFVTNNTARVATTGFFNVGEYIVDKSVVYLQASDDNKKDKDEQKNKKKRDQQQDDEK